MGTYYKKQNIVNLDYCMKVNGISKIHEFMEVHNDARTWLESWLAEVKNSKWRCPNDIKERYRSASILDDRRVIFNVRGNKYRMEVQVSFNNEVVLIKRLGTHAEYDRWDI